MHSMDLNLLVALDVLLEEESVLVAARRMHLSPSAMSRTLARVREAVGDPILVRAGKRLVPTPRAAELRPRVRAVVASASAVLRERGALDVAALTRSFAVRTSDGMLGLLGAPLLDALRAEAPGVTVRFLPEGDEDVAALREGRIDLDVGIIGEMGPEIRVQALARDRFVGVVRRGSPLASGKVTLERFVEHAHLGVSRQGKIWGPIDDALKKKGLARTTAAVASGHYAALCLLASSDLVGAFPSKWLAHAAPRFDLVTFPLPVTTPGITIAQAWHPRFDADPAHRWLRDRLRRVCRSIAELGA
ncbi:LysR family transcriptional regulator [Sorangium sp. So ce296]|uniref:LysR family transcriptional regulator n=1 Tax=Sorangium sp. So ce296 TaxID=3133296 RepID=UPI003F6356EB